MPTVRIEFQIQDSAGNGIPGRITSTPPSSIDPDPWTLPTEPNGNLVTFLAPGKYHGEISAPGYATVQRDWTFGNPTPIGSPVRIGLDSLGGLLPRLHAGRSDFFTEANARHVVIGCTDLMLAWRYDREGPDAIRPVLEQRQACGFNNLRVLWQKDVNNAGQPWQMPVEDLRPFITFLAGFGFYVQGTILADCAVVNPLEADQQNRVNAMRSATVGLSNLIEQLGNEYDKNGHDPRHFFKPSDRMAANSSSTEGGKDAPYWDFFCFSGQRDPLNHAVREYGPLEFIYGTGTWGGLPAICNEGMKPGINSSDARDFERAGAQARSGCGGTFHTDAGTAGSSRLFNDLEFACAKAFVKGIGQ